jgi:hypothetical protein
MFDENFYQERLDYKLARGMSKESYDDAFKAMFMANHGRPNRRARRHFLGSTIGFGSFWQRHLRYQFWLKRPAGKLHKLDIRHDF